MLLGIPFEDRLPAIIFFAIVLIIMLGYYKIKEIKLEKNRRK